MVIRQAVGPPHLAQVATWANESYVENLLWQAKL
jgi:hypothetical protein